MTNHQEERGEKIKHIHANFNRNGLVEETADKINELVDAVNELRSHSTPTEGMQSTPINTTGASYIVIPVDNSPSTEDVPKYNKDTSNYTLSEESIINNSQEEPSYKPYGFEITHPSQEVGWEKEFVEEFGKQWKYWCEEFGNPPKNELRKSLIPFISNLLSHFSTHLLEELEREVEELSKVTTDYDGKWSEWNAAIYAVQTLLRKYKQK